MFLSVDFGTSYSKACTMEFGGPVLLQEQGEYGTASCFYYDKDIGIVVGEEALECGQGINSINLKTEVKMDLQKNQPFTADGRTFELSEIVREIFKGVIQKAQRRAGYDRINPEIEGMVITVPAKFDYLERDLILNAARSCLDEKTPLLITGVLKEPVAAAMHCYQTTVDKGDCVMVVDIGGGTTDIALVEADPSVREYYRVIDSEMIRTGGRNWDERVISYFADQFTAQSGIDVRSNPSNMKKIRDTALHVKHGLTDYPQRIGRIELNMDPYSAKLTAAEFESMTADLMNQVNDAVKKVYNYNVCEHVIEKIICVGGSSKMPQVKKKIQEAFPWCEVRVFEPEYAVVKGAAFFADMVRDQPYTAVDIEDKTNFSYGVRIADSHEVRKKDFLIRNMIMRNTTLPAEAEYGFYPQTDGQKRLSIKVYENVLDEQRCRYDGQTMTQIGTIFVTLPPGTKKETEFKVKLALDKDLILSVQTTDLSGNMISGKFSVKR